THEVEQVLLAGNMPVERHRSCPELGRDTAHGKRLNALGVGDLYRRTHDLLAAQRGTACARFAVYPGPDRADGRVFPSGVCSLAPRFIWARHIHRLHREGLTFVHCTIILPHVHCTIKHTAYGSAAGVRRRWRRDRDMNGGYSADNGELAIRAAGVEKRFGKTQALRGVDLAAPRGTVCALLGPNGAGKTTMVRILTTLLAPDAGRAWVAGYDVAREAEQVRSRIGLAGQQAAVDELLTGRANLLLFAGLYHLPLRLAR